MSKARNEDSQDPLFTAVEVEDTSPTQPLSSRESGFETRVFNKWSVISRNVCGVLSVTTVCIVAIIDAGTVRLAVKNGVGWPNAEWAVIVVMLGLVVCAATYMNANKIISTILGEGGLKGRAKDIILRKKPVSAVIFGETADPFRNTQYSTMTDVLEGVRSGAITTALAEQLKDADDQLIMVNLVGKSDEEKQVFWSVVKPI